ncbi:MAG: ribonuclease M5 [Tenericutes bacterium]|nr:ribonuclease M5 [Mycoplasmatota bacterium]
MYNQIIVVEGKHDEQKINSIYPEVECIVTNGSEISKETLNLIYQTSLVREVIIFMDPDFPGKQITQKILDTKGKYKIAFINKQFAISKNKKKVGVEHASEADIKKSLASYFTISENVEKINFNDLSRRDLINKTNAKRKREILCKSLNIPLSNGKALLKYINILGISLERIDKIIGKLQ